MAGPVRQDGSTLAGGIAAGNRTASPRGGPRDLESSAVQAPAHDQRVRMPLGRPTLLGGSHIQSDVDGLPVTAWSWGLVCLGSVPSGLTQYTRRPWFQPSKFAAAPSPWPAACWRVRPWRYPCCCLLPLRPIATRITIATARARKTVW